MRVLFLIVRFFPYWALPVTVILLELGRFFRRKKDRKNSFVCLGIAAALVVLTVLWFAFRGDLHSDSWVRSLSG